MPDVKRLLHALPLRRASLARCFDLGLAAWLLAQDDHEYGWPRLYAARQGRPDCGDHGPAREALIMAADMECRLANSELDHLYRTLEMPLIPVLADMEQRGVAVAPQAFAAFLEEVRTELERLTQSVYTAAGGQFNIRSAQQLGELLFGVLKLDPAGKTKGGQLSTAQDALEKLSGRHFVVDTVLEFRKLEKLRSTYLEPLPRLADAAGRIHTAFQQTGTATGRLSSANPNLQNIPVRGALGRRMRTCFTAGAGEFLLAADYSQVELRVLAHMSRDPALLEAFREGVDIHARTAALMYDIPLAQVSQEQRRSAKTVNFGLLYGMGPRKLAQELGVSQAQAGAFMERYFSRLGTLKKFYEEVEAEAQHCGYVKTLAGRRRPLPGIHSHNRQESALAQRQAINTVIQGSAADVIKLAMLAVHADEELARMGVRLVLQVHDELLLETPQDAAEAAGRRVAWLMSAVRPGGTDLLVPLQVDWGYGKNWAEAH